MSAPLICRFCSQWNPASAQSCCFCDNATDATEDDTRHGTPAYLRNRDRRFYVPQVEASKLELPCEVIERCRGLTRIRGNVQRMSLIGLWVGLCVVLLVILICMC